MTEEEVQWRRSTPVSNEDIRESRTRNIETVERGRGGTQYGLTSILEGQQRDEKTVRRTLF